MIESVERIARWAAQARHMVFLGGAGVSTLSGIPDFRGAGGIAGNFEQILSHEYFMTHPREFYAFYRRRMVYPQAEPNVVHLALADWEKRGRLDAVITQNIDGLHQRAGSRRVLELHGSILKNHCMDCGRAYPLETVMEGGEVPRCACGGVIKPDVVLYDEPLPQDVWEQAAQAVAACDLLLVAGTSLRVYPAASLPQMMTRGRLVILNREPTPLDGLADGVVHGELKQSFEALARAMEPD